MKFELSDLSLINKHLAESIGVPLSTIDRAATQERLKTYRMGVNDETRVVRISEVIQWRDQHYRPINQG